MEEFPTFRARDLDLGSGHTAYRHTIVHHSLTSTYMPNVIEMEKTFVDGQGRIQE